MTPEERVQMMAARLYVVCREKQGLKLDNRIVKLAHRETWDRGRKPVKR